MLNVYSNRSPVVLRNKNRVSSLPRYLSLITLKMRWGQRTLQLVSCSARFILPLHRPRPLFFKRC